MVARHFPHDFPEREYFAKSPAKDNEYYRTGIFHCPKTGIRLVLPLGNIGRQGRQMSLTPEQLGKIARKTRQQIGVTQSDLALTSGTGLRFIGDLENGKPTCQMGKVLTVLQTLGIRIELVPPRAPRGG